MTKNIPPGARERRWRQLLAICQASPLCFFIFSFCSLLQSFYLCSGFHGNCISCLSSLALNFLFDFPSSQDMTLFSFCKKELSVVFSLVVDIFKGGRRLSVRRRICLEQQQRFNLPRKNVRGFPCRKAIYCNYLNKLMRCKKSSRYCGTQHFLKIAGSFETRPGHFC